MTSKQAIVHQILINYDSSEESNLQYCIEDL